MRHIALAPAAGPALPVVKSITTAEPWDWIADGLRDARRAPLVSFGYGALFALMGYQMHLVFTGAFHFGISLATGFLMLGSLLAMGLYDVSRRIERGETPNLVDSLRAWQGNGVSVLMFGLILGLAMLVTVWLNNVLFALTLGLDSPTLPDTAEHVLASPAGQQFLLLLIALSVPVLVLMFCVSVVAVPAMLDRKLDPLHAMLLSLRAVNANRVPMVLWALLILAGSVIGFVTLYIGLAFILPVLGHATWHAYRSLVAAPAADDVHA